jgi:hypothetical protein
MTEKALLLGFLNAQRNAILATASGVPEPAVRTAGVPSGTSLLGLVKHLGYVERFYFLGEPITSLRRTLRPTARETADGLIAAYRTAIEEADRAVEACAGLDHPAPRREGRGPAQSMRWTLLHMIEETARHAGHADILRERIDGATALR